MKIRRFFRDLGYVIRRQWWIARGERQRVLEERDRWKEAAEQRFTQMRESMHAVYALGLDCLPYNIETLRRVADQIDCGSDCEEVSPMDWSTGVRECHLSERGTCPFDDACGLRDLAAALQTHQVLTATPQPD